MQQRQLGTSGRRLAAHAENVRWNAAPPRSAQHAVAEVGDEVVPVDPKRLEGELADVVKEPLPRAEHHRDQVQPQLVDEAGGEELTRGLRTAADRDVLGAGGRAGRREREIARSQVTCGPSPAAIAAVSRS